MILKSNVSLKYKFFISLIKTVKLNRIKMLIKCNKVYCLKFKRVSTTGTNEELNVNRGKEIESIEKIIYL